MKSGFWKAALAVGILALALAACSPAGEQAPGVGSPTTAAGGMTGGDTTGGDTGAATTAATTAPGGDAGAGDGAANCVGVDTAALMSSGEALYTERCASCHGAHGEGQGDFPALAGSQIVTGEDVASLVQKYFAVDAHPKDVTPDQLAGLLSFVRGSFGNTAAAVCPTDITIPAAQ